MTVAISQPSVESGDGEGRGSSAESRGRRGVGEERGGGGESSGSSLGGPGSLLHRPLLGGQVSWIVALARKKENWRLEGKGKVKVVLGDLNLFFIDLCLTVS